MQVGAKAAKDRQEFQGKMELEGTRIGAEIARNRAQMSQQERQAARQSSKPTKGE